MWPHHREQAHHDVEPCGTVVLSDAIGRYPAGTLLCEVLDDLSRRMAQVEIDTTHGFSTVGLDAWIAPYSGSAGATGLFGLDALISVPTPDSFGLDAEIAEAVAVERTGGFGFSAVLLERGADAITVITQPVGPGDTTIHVDNPDDFPSSCPMTVQIGTETMTVVAGCGTDTWTVVRGDPTASHPVGVYIVIC